MRNKLKKAIAIALICGASTAQAAKLDVYDSAYDTDFVIKLNWVTQTFVMLDAHGGKQKMERELHAAFVAGADYSAFFKPDTPLTSPRLWIDMNNPPMVHKTLAAALPKQAAVVSQVSAVREVPLPAGLPLVLAGMGALAILRKLRYA